MNNSQPLQKGNFSCLLFFLLCAGLGMAGISVSQAEEQTNDPLSLIKPMPEVPEIAQEDFFEQTQLIERTPLNDEDLAFSIRIPDNWKERPRDPEEENVELNDQLFQEIAYFYGPRNIGDSGNFMQVMALQRDEILSADQWLLKYIFDNKFPLEGFTSHGLTSAEALYTEVEKDISYRMRVLVKINNEKLVMVKHYARDWTWEQTASMQSAMLESFRFENPVGYKGANIFDHVIYDKLRLSYPETWDLRVTSEDTIDRYSVALRTERNADSRMYFSMVSRYVADPLEDEYEAFKNSLLDQGLVLGEEIEVREDFAFDPAMILGQVKVYQAGTSEKREKPYELWLVITADAEYYYFTALLTVGRGHDFFDWAINMNTFKLFVDKIEPLEQNQL